MRSIALPPNPFIVEGRLSLPSFEQWFYLPGDWLIYLVASHAPRAAAFVGIGPDDYGGALAALLAWFAWLMSAIVLIMTAAAVRRADRACTSRIVGGVRELRRRIRVAIVSARYRQQLRTRRLEPRFDIREPTVRLRRHMR